jgi:hypothetical protein
MIPYVYVHYNTSHPPRPPGFHIFLRELFIQTACSEKVFDESPAWVVYDQSELVDTGSLQLHDSIQTTCYAKSRTLKGEQEYPVALVRQWSCGGVWPEGEEWIREALAGVIGRRHFTSSELCFSRFVVTVLLLLNDGEMCFAWPALEPDG